jgi:hypothetical protein
MIMSDNKPKIRVYTGSNDSSCTTDRMVEICGNATDGLGIPSMENIWACREAGVPIHIIPNPPPSVVIDVSDWFSGK